MTVEEAINQGIKMTDEYARNDLERYLLRKEEPIPKSVALGMKALEKQIRKKVIEDYMCPNCGADVTNQADNDYLFEHCYHCGQALDWSDSE